MIYSRLLYTEHEHPHDKHDEGGYTVFSTQQIMDTSFRPHKVICMQKFAILWQGIPDTRVIDLVEQAIITGKLSPVKLLHAYKGTLVIVYDANFSDGQYDDFQTAWVDIASYAMYDPWTALLIKESEVGSDFDGGRLFRTYAPEILATNALGIASFTSDMFLFSDEWKPENVFGEDYREIAQARSKQLREGLDLFDDDVDF